MFAARGRDRLSTATGPAPQQLTSPLGRLVIVVDEFAALADELPELLSGLVAIAARGRSLGVHLVLATQRPAGVVSAEIQANLALRIALRVTDPGDSESVIGSPKAARIDRPSRVGRSPAPAPISSSSRPAGSADCRRPRPGTGRRLALGAAAARAGDRRRCGAVTDLVRLVDAMRAASAARGTLGPPSPWLPPLPALVTFGQLGSGLGPFDGGGRPARSTRRTTPESADVDLRRGRIAADRRAGPQRSQHRPAHPRRSRPPHTRSPAQLQIYVIDCAGGGLARLAGLPHCGAALTRDDPETIARLVARLSDEVARRRADRAADGRHELVPPCCC